VSVTAEQSKNSMEGNNINNNNNSGEGYMTYTENGDRAHKQPKTTNNDETTKIAGIAINEKCKLQNFPMDFRWFFVDKVLEGLRMPVDRTVVL